ncbi:hypothetical protein Tco_1294789 [Tanacetum coccineum]
MDYFISMQLRSIVRFSALFLDLEEKSSFYPNDFPSMILQKIICVLQVTMDDANINAPEVRVAAASPPTRSDEQILPRNKWVLVGKGNCSWQCGKGKNSSQSLFKIDVDIFENTNFYKAFYRFFHHSIIYHPAVPATHQIDKRKGYSLSAGKTSAFKRPRASVLQILWGVVNKANIDYVERIWEEFTQCIHSFIEDKMNLALHTEGKKKVNPLVISGVHFTKLIINHLQSIHKFHKRPGSPLHLPYEESALGYLKFSFKNTKRVRLGMAIPDTLISEDIRSAPYYSEYMAKVTKYQRYLAGEVVSDDEAPALQTAKGGKSPKTPRNRPNRNLLHLNHPNLNLHLLSLRKRKESCSQQLVDEFVDEGVPADEPRFDDEEADMMQKGVMKESLKVLYQHLGVHFHRW